jgi:thiamine pyrophosphokinase
MNKYNLPETDRQTETVILANGEFPSHPIALSILRRSKYLVCCDGAISNLMAVDKIPNAIVGDCDSLPEEDMTRLASIIHHIPEQETNDLTKAVRFCISQGRRKITILGATGKREDHTIANVSLLCEYIHDADVEMITDYGVFVAINQNSVFKSYKGQQVSLFCLSQSVVTSRNLVYTINQRTFTGWWEATLNESLGDEFVIETNGPTIVYRTIV